MPRLVDVAKRAGVSPMTVSRVVNNSGPVSADVRARVERALAETGYVPNTLARSLRAKRTDTLALVLTDMTNPFFTTLAHGVETAAREAGLMLVLANSDEDEDEERRVVQMLVQRQVDGILVVPAGDAADTIRQCREHGTHLVLVDRQPGSPGATDVVRADSRGGAMEIGRLLLSLGHRRVAVLAGPMTLPVNVPVKLAALRLVKPAPDPLNEVAVTVPFTSRVVAGLFLPMPTLPVLAMDIRLV